MQYAVYILKATRSSRHYIGISQNVHMRLAKHNSGSVRSTRAYRPWELVYQEVFGSKTEARKRELFLKKNYPERKRIFDLV
jgi:putative endonuclease